MAGIILFDGLCNFCSGSVQFVLKRDAKKVFQFAALQGDSGKKLLDQYQLSDDVDSFILIENEKLFIKSSAALRVCKQLKGLWKVLYIFWWVPVPLRDFFYDIITKNRYKWFGKREHCMLPTPEIRERFLD
jgi:predicted DCC family thiol-disulfide oxidoreductase YuxK